MKDFTTLQLSLETICYTTAQHSSFTAQQTFSIVIVLYIGIFARCEDARLYKLISAN